MSQVVSPFRDFESAELNLGKKEGYVIAIGNCKGYTLVLQLDFDAREVRHFAYYQKLEGNRGLSRRRRDIGHDQLQESQHDISDFRWQNNNNR